MNNQSCNYDYKNIAKTMGIIKRQRIVDKTQVGLFTVISKRLTNACFHTTKGYLQVDPILTTITVQGELGRMEFIAAADLDVAEKLVREIIREKIAFEDIATIVQLKADYESIDKVVEDRLEEILPKEIEIEEEVTVDIDPDVDVRVFKRIKSISSWNK